MGVVFQKHQNYFFYNLTEVSVFRWSEFTDKGTEWHILDATAKDNPFCFDPSPSSRVKLLIINPQTGAQSRSWSLQLPLEEGMVPCPWRCKVPCRWDVANTHSAPLRWQIAPVQATTGAAMDPEWSRRDNYTLAHYGGGMAEAPDPSNCGCPWTPTMPNCTPQLGWISDALQKKQNTVVINTTIGVTFRQKNMEQHQGCRVAHLLAFIHTTFSHFLIKDKYMGQVFKIYKLYKWEQYTTTVLRIYKHFILLG